MLSNCFEILRECKLKENQNQLKKLLGKKKNKKIKILVCNVIEYFHGLGEWRVTRS
jgi:hypothetical protein